MEEIELKTLLLKYRIMNNLKQRDMAALLNCTQSQYSLWENGKIPGKLREKSIRDTIK